jgi:CHASE3 domain sensor protein
VLVNVAATEAALWRAESAQRAFLVATKEVFLVERDSALAAVQRHVSETARLIPISIWK